MWLWIHLDLFSDRGRRFSANTSENSTKDDTLSFRISFDTLNEKHISTQFLICTCVLLINTQWVKREVCVCVCVCVCVSKQNERKEEKKPITNKRICCFKKWDYSIRVCHVIRNWRCQSDVTRGRCNTCFQGFVVTFCYIVMSMVSMVTSWN